MRKGQLILAFLIETHFHTAEVSRCGRVKASDAIRLYKGKGYHAIVVTDHFYTGFFEDLEFLPWPEKVDRYLEGYNLAAEEGRIRDIHVLLGMEFTFPGTFDDILVYGVTREMLLKHPDMHRLGPSGFSRVAREEKLLLIQAHPFRPYISRVYEEMLEGLEVHNGNPRHQSDNNRALELAREKGWIQISGSDFHQREDLACGGIWLPELPSDSKAFATLLRRIRIPEIVTG